MQVRLIALTKPVIPECEAPGDLLAYCARVRPNDQLGVTARSEEKMALNKWIPESSPKILRRVGKTSEEAAELLKVCSRITIQGIGGRDPENGKTNTQALTEEIADVLAQCNVCIDTFGLDREVIRRRVTHKEALMAKWEALFDVPETVKPGTLVRYDIGSTALMLVEHVQPNHGREGAHYYYGRQCMGGTVAAYHDRLSEPSHEDRAIWARCNP